MRHIASALVLFLPFGIGCSGGNDSGGPEDVSALLQPILESRGVPALAAAEVAPEGVEAIGAVGVRKAGTGVEVRDDDRWHLGSCTKAMTATLLGSLVEDGILGWDTTLADAFPAMVLHTAYQAVTLQQLLAHQGGAPGDVPSDLWNPLWNPGDVVQQRLEFAAGLLGRAPAVPPGTQFLYSNAGYMVVGAALEEATGSSWETLMEEHLFTPLGMTSCGFGPPATSPDEVDAPWGHQASGSPVSPGSLYADNPPALGPAGTVHCSLEDWGKFAVDHAIGAKGMEGALLSSASYTRLHTPLGNGYALGWGVTTQSWANGTVLTHAGSNTMFFSVVWVAPELGRAYVAATNIADAQAYPALDDAIEMLIGRQDP